jgi:hypothetical protein
MVVVVLAGIVGCAGGQAKTATPTPAASPSRTVRSAAPAASGSGATTIEQFGGWDTTSVTPWAAFRVVWAASPTGGLRGRLVYEFVGPHRQRRRVFRFAGTAKPVRPGSPRRRVHLTLSRPLDGAQVLHGNATATHLFLTVDSDATELDLYGSSVAVMSTFRARLKALRSRGGFDGWLRRRDEQRSAVHRVDLDGDGRRDLVVVAWSHLVDPEVGSGAVDVLVHYAAGGTASVTLPVSNGLSRGLGVRIGWIGSVQLPGLPGRQVVIVSDTGAANQFYDVVGDVGGVLRSIPAVAPDYGWGDGGSVGTGSIGRYCAGGALVAWSSRSVFRRRSPTPYAQHVVINRYEWAGDSWDRVSHLRGNLRGAALRKAFPGRGRGRWGCR